MARQTLHLVHLLDVVVVPLAVGGALFEGGDLVVQLNSQGGWGVWASGVTARASRQGGGFNSTHRGTKQSRAVLVLALPDLAHRVQAGIGFPPLPLCSVSPPGRVLLAILLDEGINISLGHSAIGHLPRTRGQGWKDQPRGWWWWRGQWASLGGGAVME